VAGSEFPAVRVGIEDSLVCFFLVFFQPRHEGRPEVEADESIIVENGPQAALVVEKPGVSVGSVTLSGDTFVPVVKRMCGRLNFDLFEPGVFPWRLIEVPMYTDVA
jgi:hypothetical protein